MNVLRVILGSYIIQMSIGKAAIIAVLGIAIVFAVLAVLVGLLTLFKIIFNIKLPEKTKTDRIKNSECVVTDSEDTEDEITAVIAAAVAYMGTEESVTAPFRIKSIKKLK